MSKNGALECHYIIFWMYNTLLQDDGQRLLFYRVMCYDSVIEMTCFMSIGLKSHFEYEYCAKIVKLLKTTISRFF